MTFWNDKRVLVTGHTGFKGAWLSLWLQQLGAKVTGYALEAPTTPSVFKQARVAAGMHSIIADIRDLARLTEAMKAARPEVILHLAAQSLVRASYNDPVGTYATNVMGTVHVLEAARTIESVKAIVIVTTDKCYENREWLWGYRENDALGGRDPYSNSKACAELVTQAYRMSFDGAAIASVRAGNVIGGGDWAKDRIVPDAMRAFLAGQPLVIRNPSSTRPWQHVLEPLAGYLRLAECLFTHGDAYAEAWNFGPPDELVLPVRELADKLVAAWGGGARWETPGTPSGPHEATLLKLDATKARERLSWRPRLTIDETVRWIVEWHRAVGEGGDARAITTEQLARYAGLVG